MNILSQVMDAMRTQRGDINETKESARIVKKYKESDEKGKALIDDVFISLCGYSLETLIKNQED